jgi:hypothetical protein
MPTTWLDNKNRLLFLMSMCITVGGWLITISNWHDVLTTGAIGGLLLLLGNNVFSNMIRNIGLITNGNGSTSTNTVTNTTTTTTEPKGDVK